jgi:hypothetical protein
MALTPYDDVGAMGGLFAPAFIFGDPVSEAAVARWNAAHLKRKPAPDVNKMPGSVVNSLSPSSSPDPQRDAIAAALMSGKIGGVGGEGGSLGAGEAGAPASDMGAPASAAPSASPDVGAPAPAQEGQEGQQGPAPSGPASMGFAGFSPSPQEGINNTAGLFGDPAPAEAVGPNGAPQGGLTASGLAGSAAAQQGAAAAAAAQAAAANQTSTHAQTSVNAHPGLSTDPSAPEAPEAPQATPAPGEKGSPMFGPVAPTVAPPAIAPPAVALDPALKGLTPDQLDQINDPNNPQFAPPVPNTPTPPPQLTPPPVYTMPPKAELDLDPVQLAMFETPEDPEGFQTAVNDANVAPTFGDPTGVNDNTGVSVSDVGYGDPGSTATSNEGNVSGVSVSDVGFGDPGSTATNSDGSVSGVSVSGVSDDGAAPGPGEGVGNTGDSAGMW